MIRMIRKNKLKLIISSIVILLPMLAGLIFGGRLSEEIAIHWGFSGEADGFASPTVAFVVLPLIFLAFHWLCMILSSVLDKGHEQSPKMQGLVFWIIPTLSLTSFGMMLASALGYTLGVGAFVYVIIGVMFIVIGNYLPKTTRSRTTGIKLKWTMANDENWAATHRFGGRVWVIAGFISILATPIPMVAFPFVMFAVIALAVISPVIYSYKFYRKQLREGKATKEEYNEEYKRFFGGSKTAKSISIVAISLVLIVLTVTMFTGTLEVTLGEESMDISASFWSDVCIDYEDIDSVEYREECDVGRKVNGFNSAKLHLGIFESDELGVYTRYAYTKADSYVLLTMDGKYVVIGAESESQTKEIYEHITSKIEK